MHNRTEGLLDVSYETIIHIVEKAPGADEKRSVIRLPTAVGARGRAVDQSVTREGRVRGVK